MTRKLQDYNLYLVSILLIGFVLRITGINWGLPLKHLHIDESVVIFYSVRMLTGNLNPAPFFDYPSLFLYILFFTYAAVFLLGKTFGFYGSLDEYVGLYKNFDPSIFYLTGRFLNVIFSVATIYLVYKIGEKLSGKKAGLIASFMFSIAPLHVLHSHYATVDVPALFFAILSCYFIISYHLSGRIREFFMASFFLGLAVSTKYYPVIFILNLFAALVINVKKQKLSPNKLFPLGGVSFILILFGFFAGTPFVVIDFKNFSNRFSHIFENVIFGDRIFNLFYFGRDFLLGLKTAFLGLIDGLGLFLFVVSLMGVIWSLVKFKKNSLFFLTLPAVFIFFVSFWKVLSAHYLFPIHPFFLISGAILLGDMANKKSRIILMVVLTTLSTLPKTAYSVYLLTRPDTRVEAYRWIKKNIPAGTNILRSPSTPNFSSKDPYRVTWDGEWKIFDKMCSRILEKYDYILMTLNPEFEKRFSENLISLNEFSRVKFAPHHNPTVKIYKVANMKPQMNTVEH